MCAAERMGKKKLYTHRSKSLQRCEKTKLMRETRNKTKSKKISQASLGVGELLRKVFFSCSFFSCFFIFVYRRALIFIPKTPTRRKKARFHSFIWSYARGIYANIEKLLVCIRFHPVVFRGACSYPSKVIRDSLFDILSHPLIRRCRLLHCCSVQSHPSHPHRPTIAAAV